MRRSILVFIAAGGMLLSGCAGPPRNASSASLATVDTSARTEASLVTKRSGFIGAFFRAEGSPPYGIFLPQSTEVAPEPYPTAGPNLLGNSGYCDAKSANGASIDSSFLIDSTKLEESHLSRSALDSNVCVPVLR